MVARGGPRSGNSQLGGAAVGQSLVQSELGDFRARCCKLIDGTERLVIGRNDLDGFVGGGKKNPALEVVVAPFAEKKFH